MKNKFKLLLCCLLISAFVPINFAFAAISLDREGDGIHIDDIVVYYLSQTGSLSSLGIRDLLDQITPIIPSPTADEIAAGITIVTAPAAGKTSLTLPTVPTGYTIAINTSSNTAVVGTNGAIAPPSAATSIELMFTVTRISDSTTANTSTITVVIPAYEPIFIPRPISSINVALASNGGTATASSTHSYGFRVSSINDGDRKGVNWGNGGGWNDETVDSYPPDWAQVDFTGSKTVNEIDVITLKDNYGDPSEPTIGMTFKLYGITDYKVQYCKAGACNDVDDVNWVTVTNGSVKDNNYVWKQFTFTPVTTNKIRLRITNAKGYSRLVELEAWTDGVNNVVP